MRLESIASQPDRAGRYTAKFSDGTVLRLYRQTVEDHGLYAGKELEDSEMTALREDAGKLSAKMRAVRILSASSVSKNDLEHRLVQKGEDPAQAKEAVQWLSDMELIDDRTTARQVVSRCAAKGYGIARARQALYEKRIPKAYWQEALEDYPDQTDSIVSFLQTRLGPSWDQKELHRAMDALLRRGHSYGDIRRGLEQLSLNTEEFPED